MSASLFLFLLFRIRSVKPDFAALPQRSIRNGTGTGINIQFCLHSRDLGCNLVVISHHFRNTENAHIYIFGPEDAKDAAIATFTLVGKIEMASFALP